MWTNVMYTNPARMEPLVWILLVDTAVDVLPTTKENTAMKVIVT